MHARLFSSALCSAAIGLAVAMATFPVQAASNLNSSRSNIYRLISNDADASACLKAGGIVVVKDGKRVCEIKAPAVNLNSSKSN